MSRTWCFVSCDVHIMFNADDIDDVYSYISSHWDDPKLKLVKDALEYPLILINGGNQKCTLKDIKGVFERESYMDDQWEEFVLHEVETVINCNL
jgi:hypothetical protein